MYVIESKNLILKEANSTIKSLILINPRKERSIYIHFNERVENITEMLDDLNISYIIEYYYINDIIKPASTLT